MSFAYLIRLPNEDAHERAIMAFLKVRQPTQVFTDRRMLVTAEHIELLRQEGIPFEDITEDARGKNTKKTRKAAPRPS
ncbi:MAG: hypothetical protein L0Z62_32150 [Gemmataceae bacterium]|nr:hypothetical protein [Gemmataceae bacterium]